jgi:hypothetical protein
MPFSSESVTDPPKAPKQQPPTPFIRAWDRATETIDPMVVTGVAVAIAVAAVIAVVVLAAKGSGSRQLPNVTAASAISTEAATTESTPTESTSTETTATMTIESSQVEQVLGEYTHDYSNEDVESLKELFAEGLERDDGSKAPEDLAVALATYEHQFGELQKPTYSLSETSVEPGSGEASATSRYSITSQNGTVTGSITFHLVEQNEKLLIDKLTIEPSK